MITLESKKKHANSLADLSERLLKPLDAQALERIKNLLTEERMQVLNMYVSYQNPPRVLSDMLVAEELGISRATVMQRLNVIFTGILDITKSPHQEFDRTFLIVFLTYHNLITLPNDLPKNVMHSSEIRRLLHLFRRHNPQHAR